MNVSDVLQMLVSTLLTAAVGCCLRAMRRNVEVFRVAQTAQQALIKDRIVSVHAASVAAQHIDSYALATAEELYEAYHKLGGNGFVHTLMHDIRRLPVIS